MAVIEVSIDPHNDLTIFVVTGELTADEIIKKMREYSTKLILWDATDGTVADITTKEFQEIARIAAKSTEKRKDGKTAFVGGQTLDYGLARMYEAFAGIEKSPYEYRTFRSAQEAKQWLIVKEQAIN